MNTAHSTAAAASSLPSFFLYSFSALEAALNKINATEIEREVAHVVARTRGTEAALRVCRGFREADGYAGPQLQLPW